MSDYCNPPDPEDYLENKIQYPAGQGKGNGSGPADRIDADQEKGQKQSNIVEDKSNSAINKAQSRLSFYRQKINKVMAGDLVHARATQKNANCISFSRGHSSKLRSII